MWFFIFSSHVLKNSSDLNKVYFCILSNGDILIFDNSEKYCALFPDFQEIMYVRVCWYQSWDDKE